MSNYWIAALLACAMLLPGCGSQSETTKTSPAADDPLEALQTESPCCCGATSARLSPTF